MKHLLIFLLLFCFGCKPGSEETPPPYPATYVFEKIESKPSKFYVLGQGTAYSEIPPKGSFLDYDQVFVQEINDEKQFIFYVDSIRLTDVANAQLHLNPAFSQQVSSVEATYTQNENYFKVEIVGATVPLLFQLDPTSQHFRWGLISTAYTYLNNNTQKTAYSPYMIRDGAFETTASTDSLLNSIRAKPGVRVADTVAVTFPVGIYLRK